MANLESIARIIAWTGRNTAHNLDFIPDDKLSWKPAPTASSALEIVDHMTHVVRNITAILQKAELPALQPTLTREQAQGNLVTAINDFAAYINTLSEEDVESMVTTTRMGEVPMRRLITIAMIDTAHHHGQITYIQTLLGDNESHFVERDF
jgi:uncharacterized damage-inducible protein DinB